MKRSVSTRRLATAIALVSLATLAGGCSTVSGFADFVGGVARDVKDAAEGSRDRAGAGEWSGVYGNRND